jgi:alcohol dehydrogenase YqhD (iron-dependent ADH family)
MVAVRNLFSGTWAITYLGLAERKNGLLIEWGMKSAHFTCLNHGETFAIMFPAWMIVTEHDTAMFAMFFQQGFDVGI